MRWRWKLVASVSEARAKDDRGREVVRAISLDVRAGEILGVAGVAGNGQDELVELITGLRKPTAGTVTIAGTGQDLQELASRAPPNRPRELYEAGLAHVPADRHRWAMIMSFPLEDNLVLTSYYRPPFARGMVRQEAAIDDWAKELIERFDIRTPSATVPTDTLSGGNQQKAVVAREFSGEAKVLILDQPTRGLDVGSIEFIYQRVIEMRNAGAAILLVSAELDEVLAMSDRIAVMYRGEIVATVDGRTANKEEIGLLMATGGKSPQASAASVAAG